MDSTSTALLGDDETNTVSKLGSKKGLSDPAKSPGDYPVEPVAEDSNGLHIP